MIFRRGVGGPGVDPKGVGLLADGPVLLWRRVAARLVDVVTVFCVLWMLVMVQVLWFMHDLAARWDGGRWGRGLAPLVTFVVLSGVYEVVFVRFNGGQTPGKDLLDVRVVRRSDGGDVGLVRAALRWLVPGLAVLVWPWWLAVLAGLGLAVTVPLGGWRRCVHDLLAGTVVVFYRRDDELTGSARPWVHARDHHLDEPVVAGGGSGSIEIDGRPAVGSKAQRMKRGVGGSRAAPRCQDARPTASASCPTPDWRRESRT